MRSLRWFSAVAAALIGASAMAQVVFQDDFETDSSANYLVKKRNATTALPSVPVDSKVEFAFDYGVAWPYDGLTYTGADPGRTIPPAPGQATTKGLYIRVNEDLAENRSVEAVQVIPKLARLQGDYKLSCYIWYEVTSGATSTQLGGLGIEHNGGPGFMQGDGGSGYFFQYTGDGSSTRDYRLYNGLLEQLAPSGGWVATGTGIHNNTNAHYSSYFTTAAGFPIAGAPGRQWVKVTMERTGGDVKVMMERTDGASPGPLSILTYSDSAFTNGYPMVGMFDPAASPRPADHPLFILVDGLRVEGTLAPVLSGRVELTDYAGTYPRSVTLEPSDINGNPLTTVTAGLDAEGNYSVPNNPDYASVRVKTRHFLGKRISVDGSQTVSDANFALVNGDVDGDNAVTIFDYIDLSAAFDLVVSDPSFTGNAFADLDGDDTVTIFDYIILSNNFDLSGDE